MLFFDKLRFHPKFDTIEMITFARVTMKKDRVAEIIRKQNDNSNEMKMKLREMSIVRQEAPW